MAKKRIEKLQKKKKQKIRQQKEKQTKILLGHYSTSAFVLICIAVIFLLLNGISTITARYIIAQQITTELQKTQEAMGAFPIQITIEQVASVLLTISIIWLILAFLIAITTYQIEITRRKTQKWFLLTLAILTFISGRFLAGILVIIASIIYFRKK